MAGETDRYGDWMLPVGPDRKDRRTTTSNNIRCPYNIILCTANAFNAQNLAIDDLNGLSHAIIIMHYLLEHYRDKRPDRFGKKFQFVN